MYNTVKHDEKCESPEVKRLYLRQVNKETGKQRYIAWGSTCLCCDALDIDYDWYKANKSRYYKDTMVRIPVKRKPRGAAVHHDGQFGHFVTYDRFKEKRPELLNSSG